MVTTRRKAIEYKVLSPADLVTEISTLRRHGYDVVGRSGIFGLPLILGSSDIDYAFRCARAELWYSHRGNSADLELILKAKLTAKTLKKHFYDEGTKQLNLVLTDGKSFTALDKRKIIELCYPWYSQSTYIDFCRIAKPENLGVTFFDQEGRYRYFRSYPLSSRTFRLVDGYIVIKVDRSKNMILFGQIMRPYTRTYSEFRDSFISDDSYTVFEHRGFAIPTSDRNLTLISFREGCIRFANLRLVSNHGSGLIVTSTVNSGRPFAAKALIVKEGHQLFDVSINIDNSMYLDVNDPNFPKISKAVTEIDDGTIFPDNGWMWGTPEIT